MVRSTSLEELPSCCEEDEGLGESRARSSSGIHDNHEALISKLSADWGMSKSYQFSSVVRHTDSQTGTGLTDRLLSCWVCPVIQTVRQGQVSQTGSCQVRSVLSSALRTSQISPPRI